MARPTKLTEAVRDRIVTAIRAGNYAEPAARAAGISPSTYYRWASRGEREQTGIYRDFLEAGSGWLHDPEKSPLYVFFDDNQRLFAVPKNLPVAGEPLQLTVNCRNTKSINRIVAAYYSGGTIQALGPEGPAVDAHFYSDENEFVRQLDTSVRRWIREAEVRPGDIALLTPKSAERSALWRIEQLGGVELTDDPWEENKILRASIYRFKGLERLVVAVTELDGAREAALYVGFSRPNVFLSVFCPESERRRLPAELSRAA